jgi:hypothetical protein
MGDLLAVILSERTCLYVSMYLYREFANRIRNISEAELDRLTSTGDSCSANVPIQQRQQQQQQHCMLAPTNVVAYGSNTMHAG